MIATRPFGRTGHLSSRAIFGAAGLGSMRQERADATLALVAAAGVNHIDTAAAYGASEDRLRPFLADNRERFYLATKTGERGGAAARAELERSLERMGVERVDLIQLHNLVEPDEWDTAFARDGAVAALAAAREEGLVGAIGVTGHGIRIASMHLRSLERFDFDSVLLPYNWMLLAHDAYRADVDELRQVCADRAVAVQTIKAIARRRWANRSDPHRSWYEPLTDPAAIGRVVRLVLAEDDLFLVTTSDAERLPDVLGAARGDAWQAPTPAELAADVASFDMAALFDGAALERI